jgi:hypothetical protein
MGSTGASPVVVELRIGQQQPLEPDSPVEVTYADMIADLEERTRPVPHGSFLDDDPARHR